MLDESDIRNMNKVPQELSGGDDHKAVTCHVPDHHNFLMHIKTCTNGSSCSYPRCSFTQGFINHYRKCNTLDCRVCFLVRNRQHKRKELKPDVSFVNETYDTRVVSGKDLNQRLKIDQVLQSIPPGHGSSSQSYAAYSDPRALQQRCPKIYDVMCMEMDNSASLPKGSLSADKTLVGMSNDGSSM